MFQDPANMRSRLLAGFLLIGGAFLFYRAAFLIWVGHAARYVFWLRGLTFVELALAAVIVATAAIWLAGGSAAWRRRTLQLTAALIVLHALRVAVFALARTGPWIDFDVRPEHRPVDPATWSWVEVWFASGMAGLSLIVLLAVLVWRSRTRAIHK